MINLHDEQEYFYLDSTGIIRSDYYDIEDRESRCRYKTNKSFGNVFLTEEDCLDKKHEIKTIVKWKELAESSWGESKGEVLDIDVFKFNAVYSPSMSNSGICVAGTFIPCHGQELFKTRESCEKAIQLIGEDKVKRYILGVK